MTSDYYSIMGEGSFDSIRQPLGNVLKVHICKVPPNQRDFEWEEYLWEDFFDDLINSFDAKDLAYFFGSTIFEYDKENEVFVYDGQQRLAVTTILWAVIRDLLWELKKFDTASIIQRDFISEKSVKGKETLKLTLNLRSQDFFYRCIQLSPDNTEERKSPDAYEKSHGKLNEPNNLIKKCYTYFKERFEEAFKDRKISTEKEKTDFLTDISEHLKNHFILVIIKVGDEEEAYMVYESVNQKRADLSVADLFKNYLIRQASKKGEDKSKIVDGWKEIADELDDKIKPFLKHNWNSKNIMVTDRRLFKELKKYAEKQKISIVNFLSELREEALVYSSFLNPDEPLWKDSEITKLLKDFNKLDAKQCLPILLSAYKIFNETEFKSLLNNLINFTFRFSTICNKHNNILERRFNQISIKIRSKEINNAKEALKKLQDLYPSKREFEIAFADKKMKEGKLARYLLSKIDSKKCNYGDIKAEYDVYSLEHILPQNPDKEWKKYFAKKGIGEEEIQDLKYRIGNLTLLDQPMNKDAKNHFFPKKQKKVYKNSKLWINEDIKKIKEWNEKIIADRQKKLGIIAEDIWKIDF